jgi:methionyl-tRNA synthetase
MSATPTPQPTPLSAPAVVLPSTIVIDDFAKCDIRIGLITEAKPVPDSKKLIQLTVDFGTEIGMRTILTGLLAYYPDTNIFQGKKFLFLVNLAPRKMAGIESQGMFLAPDGAERPTLIEVPSDAIIGARLH